MGSSPSPVGSPIGDSYLESGFSPPFTPLYGLMLNRVAFGVQVLFLCSESWIFRISPNTTRSFSCLGSIALMDILASCTLVRFSLVTTSLAVYAVSLAGSAFQLNESQSPLSHISSIPAQTERNSFLALTRSPIR